MRKLDQFHHSKLSKGEMKKTLTLVVLGCLMLTGCGGKQEAVPPAASATVVSEVADAVTVPGVSGLTLDKATDNLEDLGLKVKAEDTVDGKMIISEKNCARQVKPVPM